jgi:hypothetical protein
MKVYINGIDDGAGNYIGIGEEEGKECPLLSPPILEIVNSIKKNRLYADSWDQIKKNYQEDTVKNEKDMQDIIDKRNELVKHVQRDFCEKCNFNISGSKSLTSDIDITVLNTAETKTNHLFAFKEINTMVKVMKCLFDDKESLETLDINFYGHSYFFSQNLAGVCKQYKNQQEFFLPLDEKMEKKYRYSEALALLKVKKYYQEADARLKKKWKLNFDDCKRIIHDFSRKSKSGDENDIFDYVNDDKDISLKNKYYLKQLEYIDKLSHNENKIPKDILRYQLISEINHASVYSDESYFSYGAFMHVVYGDQMKRDISKLPKMIYIQSMLDNFGDIIKVYNHTAENPDLLFSKGSKYIVRIYAAILACSKSYEDFAQNILSTFTDIRELYKTNPKNPEIQRLIKKNRLTLDKIKNHVYQVYEDYLNNNMDRKKKSVKRKSVKRKSVKRKSVKRKSHDGLNFKNIILRGMRAQSRLNFFNLPQPLQPPLPLPQLK